MNAKRALIAPLRAVTPPRHMAHLVASRSYLSYSKEELRDKLSHNPYSYVQVIHPDVSMEMESQRGTTAFFQEVKKAYNGFKSKGWLKASQHPEWYIYRQQSERGQWTGVVCNLDLDLSDDDDMPLNVRAECMTLDSAQVSLAGSAAMIAHQLMEDRVHEDHLQS